MQKNAQKITPYVTLTRRAHMVGKPTFQDRNTHGIRQGPTYYAATQRWRGYRADQVLANPLDRLNLARHPSRCSLVGDSLLSF